MNPEIAPAPAAVTRLWQKEYLLLFLSRLVKVVAENFANLAYMWLMFEVGGNAFSSSMLYISMLVPQLLLSVLVGPWLARGRLTHWMFASDTVRAVLVLVIPLCYHLHLLPLWLFYVTGIVQSCCGAVYTPASSALLPSVVEKQLLQKANSTLVSGQQIINLAGLMGAGALVTLLSASSTLFITAVLFFGSALLILLVRPVQTKQQAPIASLHVSDAKQKLSYWQNIRLGFVIVRRHKLIFLLNLYCIFVNVGYAPWDTLSSLFVYRAFDGHAAVLTYLRIASVIGAFLIGLVLAKINVTRHGALFVVAGLVQGLALTGIGLSHSLWSLLLCSALIGMSMTAINVPEAVIIQTSVPLEQQPQVWGVITALSSMLMPVAGLIVGTLADRFGTGVVILSGGALMFLSGLIVLTCTPIVKLRPEMEPK